MLKKAICAIGTMVAAIMSSNVVVYAEEEGGGGGGVNIGTALDLIVRFTTVGGGLWLIWGVIVLAGGLKDKSGPALQAGIWQIVGGGLIVAAAILFNNIVVP